MGSMSARGAVVRRYLTRSEVARLFEVSPATVARWTREGRLPFVLTLGGQRRYVRDQVVALLPKEREFSRRGTILEDGRDEIGDGDPE